MVLNKVVLKYIFVKLQDLEKDTEFRFLLGLTTDMYKNFVYLNNTEERINEFLIGYMFNPTLYVNKDFKEQV